MQKFWKLFRRHSRITDSLHYSFLLPKSLAPSHSCSRKIRESKVRLEAVPTGHLPVYIGEEMKRFVVSTWLLNHPMFVKLLDDSAQEYDYNQPGALRLPCHVDVFERFVEALRVGDI